MSDFEKMWPEGEERQLFDMMADVEEFHTKFKQTYDGKPRVLDQDLFWFRQKFHYEEIDEYQLEQEMLRVHVSNEDHQSITEGLNKQLDALCDAAYVILGTAYLQFGAERFKEAWRRVQSANMAKELANPDGDERSHRDTKFDIVKPEGWQAPDHTDLVRDHAHRES